MVAVDFVFVDVVVVATDWASVDVVDHDYGVVVDDATVVVGTVVVATIVVCRLRLYCIVTESDCVNRSCWVFCGTKGALYIGSVSFSRIV